MKSVNDIVKKLLYIMNSKQKVQYVFVCIVCFIGSMFELLGVTAILPFIEAIMTPDELQGKWYYEIVVALFNPETTLELLTILAVFIIVIYVIKNIYLMFSCYVQSWYSTSLKRDLAIKLTNIFLHSPYLFHLDVNSSVLIRIVNQDVEGVFVTFFYLFRVIAELFTVAAISIYIIILDPVLAISLVLILGICMAILFMGLKKIIKRSGQIAQECESKMFQYLSQSFTGIKEILVMNRQDYFSDSYNKTCTTNARVSKNYNFLYSISTYIYEAVCIGGLIAIVTIRLHMNDDITAFVTKLAIVAVAAFRLFPAVGRLTTNINSIIYNRPRLDSIYDVTRKLNDKESFGMMPTIKESGDKLSFNDSLVINSINWQYPAGDSDVLHGLNMTVHKGESVALIGASGAGKTTLADVILGLLKPQKGNITLDGTDVYENPAGWAKVIGYVPQSVYLIDDTIRNNVAFGVYSEDISDERIWKALEEAQLAEFIKSLKDGLDTMVGEGGVRLSGGQRQRIAIARALYENPEILVLDEATSALDTETETAVMESIDALHGTKTMIIVAHRLTTIRNCDSIYEIKDGVATKRLKEEVIK